LKWVSLRQDGNYFGVFDLLHFWNFELFRRIRELVGQTGKVYVMAQIDESIARVKSGGKHVYVGSNDKGHY